MNTNDTCTVNKRARTMLWITWLFYAFGMILKISQYANLLYLQKHGREFVDGLSFIDILSNMDNFAPGWPLIIYESIRLAAFALLAICIASVRCKRLEKAANAVIIAHTAIILIYALPGICFPPRFFVMFSIVMLLIFVIFRFTELKKHKHKIYMVATAVVSSAVVFDRLLYMALEMLPMVDAAMLVFLLALRCLCDNEEQSETFSPLDNLSESTVPNDENQTTETTDEEKLSRQRFIEWIMICLWVVSILFIPLRAFATDGINMQNSDYKYNISFAGVSVCKYIGDEDTCEVVVPNRIMGLRVREIDSEAFRGCDKISDISLPEGLRVIRRHAFADCGNLKTISIPDSVTQIEPGCFEDCVSLAYVKLPKQLNGISEGLFTNCKSLKEIDMPDTMEYLRRYAFAGCESLESISIPNGVRSIEYATFAECIGLRTVELSDSVEQIQSIAFIGCPSLREIYIPASVTEIGASAFDATITICAPSGSYAIEYAIEYGYAYVEM